ncbi:lanthionine synthetase LanC family protein [Flavobacterium agrisoli]|uniref:Uncharacterized protein n=1 Tax=Flavobacterium agrisoli TaxID=2793066 RepID=A0A934UJ09_9FLAO|nr:lanthionine synthetase LanC family protein [Flavobacterium agrisoli]MBK0369119.1 hypothetical protein [Flavobacterium agrisoli]
MNTFYISEFYIEEGININELNDNAISLILNWIEKSCIEDKDFDLVGGGAGTILYLIKLYDRIKNNRILKLCEIIAENIIDKAKVIDNNQICWLSKFEKASTGFFTGTSGIGNTLLNIENGNFTAKLFR